MAGEFRFADPTCGSFGFGSVTLSRLKGVLEGLAGLSDSDKETLY